MEAVAGEYAGRDVIAQVTGFGTVGQQVADEVV